MKFATPIGASLSKSWQRMSPTLVWITAAGPALGDGTGVRTGGFAEGAAWPAASREANAKRTSVEQSVRIGIPWIVLATSNCTQAACRRGLVDARSRLHFTTDPLGLTEHAQQIPTQDLPDVVSTVPAIEQGLRDLRQIGR